EKLIRRHPHIFADTEAQTDEDVKKNWEAIKLKEGKKHSVLAGVPHSLPALVKAYRIQEKARGVGFDWENAKQVWEKVEEERGELQAEIQAQSSQERVTEEFGDLLFSLVNYARFIGVNPEDALELANRKFIRRFQHMEARTIMQDKPLSDMSLDEMNRYWDEAKAAEKAE
ncbi:MAG: MazG family protein, partial [Bacteroidales bacterium]|nr:MazG family protein [Bacteroidales bacterium]